MAVTDETWLKGRRTWVVAAGADMTSGLTASLVAHGAEVALLSDDEATCAAAPVGVRLPGGLENRTVIEAGVARLAETLDAPQLVVVSIAPPEALQIAPITRLTEAAWRAGASDGLLALLHLLQALGPRLKGRRAAVAVVGPSLSLVGCPDLVALTTLLEGQRGLVKSVARQWGATGVTLNWIAAAPGALSPLFDKAALAAKPDAVSVALGRPPGADEIAPVLGFLASPAGRAITGATLTLDGGEWMVP